METIIKNSVGVHEFLSKLSTVTFDNLEEITKFFPKAEVNRVSKELADIFVDNFIFTVHKYSVGEGSASGYVLNYTMILYKDVEVYVKDNTGAEWQEDAEVHLNRTSGKFYLEVRVTVE